MDIIARYTQTFLLLQRYDDGLLTEPKGTVGGALPKLAEARAEAGPLFGQEREQGLESILGNLEQSVFGGPAFLGKDGCAGGVARKDRSA